MKRLILLVSLAAIIFSYPINALASNISNAIYQGTIVVSNNSTSTATSVSANMTLSSADLISQGYVTSSFSNAAIRNNAGSDVPFMPGYGSNPWIFWVPSIAANSQLNYVLYTGGSDMSSTKSYFPGTTGATVNDVPSLEHGANFSDSYDNIGLFATANLSRHGTAIVTTYDLTTQNITVSVGAAAQSPTATVAAPGWANPNNSWDGNTGTSATYNSGGGGGLTPYLEVSNPAFYADSVNVFVAVITNVTNMEVDVFYGAAWHNVFNGMPAAGWNTAAFTLSSVTEVRVRETIIIGLDPAFVSEIELDRAAATLTKTGIAPREYSNITVTNNSTTLGIQVEGGAWTTTSGRFVADVVGNWIFSEGVSYVGRMKQSIGGTLRGDWQWEYAATFTDLSGNGNTMTPSFPTGSSNPNVWGTLTTFSPVTQANAPAYTVTNPQAFYSTNVSLTGNFSSGNVTGSGLPGSSVVDDAARAAGLPNVFLWGLFGGLFLVAGGFLISALSRFWGAGNGELIARMIWGIFVLGVLIALGKFDMWMLWFYLILTIAMALASRHNEVGAYFSELNFIGFLSMAEVGMITINRILEGSFINSTDASQFNNLMFTQQFTILNVFTLPIVNFDFFTKGLPNLLKWNYVMFGGNAQMIQYLLYALTAIMGFIIFGLVIGTLSHYFTK